MANEFKENIPKERLDFLITHYSNWGPNQRHLRDYFKPLRSHVRSFTWRRVPAPSVLPEDACCFESEHIRGLPEFKIKIVRSPIKPSGDSGLVHDYVIDFAIKVGGNWSLWHRVFSQHAAYLEAEGLWNEIRDCRRATED